MICLHRSLILSLYLQSPRGSVTERIKNKGRGQKRSGPICLRGLKEMEATSFPLPIIFIWPQDRRWRLWRSSGDPKIRLWNAETHTLICGSVNSDIVHSSALIKQHACPPGPIKAVYTVELKEFPHLSLYQSLVYRLVLVLVL